MSDFFSQKEAEYQAAVAAQDAERRKQAQAERAKVKKEADEIYAGLIEAFPAPAETPVEDTRSFRDMVRDNLDSITPGERERMRVERYKASKAAQEAAAERKQQRRKADELGLDHLVNPPELDWDEIDHDDSDAWDDED